MYITMTISQVRKSRYVGSEFSNLLKATQLIRDVVGGRI